MQKKILIVTEYFYPEEFKINELAIELKRRGHHVDVLTQCPTYPMGAVYPKFNNSWFQLSSYEGMNVYRVKAVTGYKNSVFKKLLKYFTFMILGSVFTLRKGKQYDYVFGYDVGALTGMFPAVILKKFYKKKVTLWIQDIWPDSIFAYGFRKTKLRSFFIDKFVRFIYRNSDNLVISGPGFEDKVRPYSSHKDIHFAPNWADELDLNCAAFDFNKDKKINFTFAGNVGKVQNLEIIIDAFSQLSANYCSKAQLNIIGDGSNLEFLKKRAANHKNIVFWGKKPRNDMSKYYNGSDVLIISLVDESIFSLTIPSKLQTYISAKKPIFSIIRGDVSTIVEENKLGKNVSPIDLQEIKQGFMHFIDCNGAELEQYATKSEYLTKYTFNKEKVIDKLEDLII